MIAKIPSLRYAAYMAQKEKTDRQKLRVSKEDWLNTALEVLASGGIEAVRIERLARRLGVAKSGFYYHFRDLADLQASLLDLWVAFDRGPIIEKGHLSGSEPAKFIESIAEIVERDDLGKYDLAIRQWARKDLKVRRIWRREMKERLSILRGQFEALGFKGDELEMRTRLFAGYQISERELFSDLTIKKRNRLRQLRLEFLLTP